MKKLYIGNLPFQATEEQINALFTQTGVTAANVTLVRDRFSGQPRGFGFVEMTNEDDAAVALRAMNGKELAGRPLRVEAATSQRRPFERNVARA